MRELWILHTLIMLISPEDFKPTDEILLNCGGPILSLDLDGRSWSTDRGSNFGSGKSNMLEVATNDPALPQVPFMTVQIFESPYTYSFPVASGWIFLRLYFYLASYSGLNISDARFGVTSQSYTLLWNFSVLETTLGSNDHYVVKEYSIHIDGGTLNLTFTPSTTAINAYAFVNGIEVMSMPNIYTSTDDDVHVIVCIRSVFNVDNRTALENVYRLNVGGSNIPGSRDTGMFRSWSADASFILGTAFGAVNGGIEVNIEYPPGTPSYIAPTIVFSSARSMGANTNINLSYNLTWTFSIDSGFAYLVRLHFCEGTTVIIKVNQRVFQIFLANQSAFNTTDVIAWASTFNLPLLVEDFKPTHEILLHCGGPILSLDLDGRSMSIDRGSNFGSGKSTMSEVATNDPPVPQVPFMTARIFESPYTYSFLVASGWIFLMNFSVLETTLGSKDHYVVKEYSIHIDGGTLNLTFTPSTTAINKDAFVNGIEVISVFTIENRTTLENVYRLNVGGSNIPGSRDTGMFRSWSADASFILGTAFGAVNGGIEVNIEYPPGTPSYIAPTIVFSSARSMGPNANINLSYNLTWTFSIDSGFAYLVRLHFCEGTTVITKVNQRVFKIFLANQSAFNTVDVISWPTEDFKPTDEILLNCGGPILVWILMAVHGPLIVARILVLENPPCQSLDLDGRSWSTDRGSNFGSGKSTMSEVASNDPAVPQNPFMTARIFESPYTYSFPVASDWIFLRLYFYSVSYSRLNISYARFGVTSQCYTLFRNFSVLETTLDSNDHYVVKEYSIHIDGGTLNVTFTPSTTAINAYAFITFCRRRHSTSEGRPSWFPLSLFSNSPSPASANTNTTRSYKSSLPQNLCRHFSFAEMKAVTNNFDETLILGVGGFGKVYKGEIDGGSTIVAIKPANPLSKQGEHEFQTEIQMLSELRHRHLVSVIGYCEENTEMILVYDHMAYGTLREHLDKTQKHPLPWKQRLEICIGAAQGLHYLHTGVERTIIHRDVKTTNILLDEKWVAKVSDFGLSKTYPSLDNTHVTTEVKGSFGYLDPEYYRRQQMTDKSDVYSFGVVIFEILCARPALNVKPADEEMNLGKWAAHCYKTGILDQISDPYLKGKIVPECFKKFAETAMKCVADQGIERPSMGDVLWNLELALRLQKSSEDTANPEDNANPEDSGNSLGRRHCEEPLFTDVKGKKKLDYVTDSGNSGDSTSVGGRSLARKDSAQG
ncbi:receptor-like protein kinase FERONIA [Cicer arietinum]|uniref:Receptor-like protein kinase FERONIA n=1 Tax=Cicer arietinum TaxID=3827 RepID=A0A3Q7XRY5_CICAR|nr:receptor-like protein kinase FERONIA [Cicer arietinum]